MSTTKINDSITIDDSVVSSSILNSDDTSIDYMKRYRQHITKPAHHLISEDIVKDQIKNVIDYRILLEHFHNEGRISEAQIYDILKKSNEVLLNEPNFIEINNPEEKPVYIIGDIHGQYYDLINILKSYDLKKDTLLFLGDYVDRGKFSIEVYLLLLAIKTCYPKNIFLLRGNHETMRMTRYFTFREEVIHKYNDNIYLKCCESFKNLPLVAIVNKNFYCAHGGISPYMEEISEINSFDRNTEPPLSGIMCDILWSDPHPRYENMGRYTSDYIINTQRNCSFFYTPDAVKKFLDKNKLLCLIRGHEVQLEGFKIHKSSVNTISNKKYTDKNELTPSVITIFSAPNYCDAYNNYGAVIKVNGDKLKIKKFSSVEHPFYLPNFLDGLNWSFPFLGEKTSEFFMDLLKYLGDQELVSSDSTISSTITDDSMHRKNMDYAKELEDARIFSGSMGIMRTERECLNELEDEESSELPCCSIKTVVNEEMTFDEVKDKDHINEKIKSKDNIFESSSVSNSPSTAPEISKILENVNLKETIKKTELSVDETKKVIDVKVNAKKKPNKNALCCFLRKK